MCLLNHCERGLYRKYSKDLLFVVKLLCDLYYRQKTHKGNFPFWTIFPVYAKTELAATHSDACSMLSEMLKIENLYSMLNTYISKHTKFHHTSHNIIVSCFSFAADCVAS